MRDNPSLIVELNVHGNRQYEVVVMERIAKFEAICLQQHEANQAEFDIPEVVPVDDIEGEAGEDDNLLMTDGDCQDEFVVTDFLLPNSTLDDFNINRYGEKDNIAENSSLEFPLDAPDKTIEESKEPAEQRPLIEASLVDVQKDSDFAIAVDSSLIIVKNMLMDGMNQE